MIHFLTEQEQRERYVEVLCKALQPEGHAVVATFGPQGPVRCSGLDVQRYSVERLGALLGPDFQLRAHGIEEHVTPTGTPQQFLYGWWQAVRL